MLLSSIGLTVLSYAIPTILLTIGGVMLIVCLALFFMMARQQHKLYNSIRLVELKQPRVIFILITGCLIALIVFVSIMIISPFEFVAHLNKRYGMNLTQAMLSFGAMILISASTQLLIVQMFLAKAAVVDRGIYLGSGFIDWHHIYDYYVDSEKQTLILSTNKKGPLTIKGTSIAFKFNRADIEKIKFILNKNKNKFIPSFELR